MKKIMLRIIELGLILAFVNFLFRQQILMCVVTAVTLILLIVAEALKVLKIVNKEK